MDLNKRCSVSDSEWQERQKTRAAEISAVSEAIAIIAGDDAHDTFGRTFSFLQATPHQSETYDRLCMYASAFVGSAARTPGFSTLHLRKPYDNSSIHFHICSFLLQSDGCLIDSSLMHESGPSEIRTPAPPKSGTPFPFI